MLFYFGKTTGSTKDSIYYYDFEIWNFYCNYNGNHLIILFLTCVVVACSKTNAKKLDVRVGVGQQLRFALFVTSMCFIRSLRFFVTVLRWDYLI